MQEKLKKSPKTSIQVKTMREGNLFKKAKLNDFFPSDFPPSIWYAFVTNTCTNIFWLETFSNTN